MQATGNLRPQRIEAALSLLAFSAASKEESAQYSVPAENKDQ